MSVIVPNPCDSCKSTKICSDCWEKAIASARAIGLAEAIALAEAEVASAAISYNTISDTASDQDFLTGQDTAYKSWVTAWDRLVQLRLEQRRRDELPLE